MENSNIEDMLIERLSLLYGKECVVTLIENWNNKTHIVKGLFSEGKNRLNQSICSNNYLLSGSGMPAKGFPYAWETRLQSGNPVNSSNTTIQRIEVGEMVIYDASNPLSLTMAALGMSLFELVD